MIEVLLNETGFEYDIHSLVKAFYPEEEVRVFEEGTKESLSEPGTDSFRIISYNRKFLRKKQFPVIQRATGEMRTRAIGRMLLRSRDRRESFAERNSISFSEPRYYRMQCFRGGEMLLEMDSQKLKEGYTKSDERIVLKKLIYSVLSCHLGKKLPWGSLTGIRPTKIAMTKLAAGERAEDIYAYMLETYDVSPEKESICLDIAQRELGILKDVAASSGGTEAPSAVAAGSYAAAEGTAGSLSFENTFSLYIGIPFCPTTCLYCSFTSYPIRQWSARMPEYLAALEKEMHFTAELMRGKRLISVYIGGGTPTTLTAKELEWLLGRVRTIFDFSYVREFTVEAGRPDSITEDRLLVLKEHGAGRISINPQTMNDDTLKRIGRQHDAAMVRSTFELARRLGFDNINMDLILGLPGEGAEEVRHTLSELEKLSPDSLTVHSLAIKRASKLAELIRNNGYITLENTDETIRLASESALRMGMKPYYLYRQKNMSGNFENVGYAREGCYGLYNILIMEEVQSIVALGAGTVTKRVYPDGRIERCDSVKDVSLYIDKIEEMIDRKRRLFEE